MTKAGSLCVTLGAGFPVPSGLTVNLSFSRANDSESLVQTTASVTGGIQGRTTMPGSRLSARDDRRPGRYFREAKRMPAAIRTIPTM